MSLKRFLIDGETPPPTRQKLGFRLSRLPLPAYHYPENAVADAVLQISAKDDPLDDECRYLFIITRNGDNVLDEALNILKAGSLYIDSEWMTKDEYHALWYCVLNASRPKLNQNGRKEIYEKFCAAEYKFPAMRDFWCVVEDPIFDVCATEGAPLIYIDLDSYSTSNERVYTLPSREMYLPKEQCNNTYFNILPPDLLNYHLRLFLEHRLFIFTFNRFSDDSYLAVVSEHDVINSYRMPHAEFSCFYDKLNPCFETTALPLLQGARLNAYGFSPGPATKDFGYVDLPFETMSLFDLFKIYDDAIYDNNLPPNVKSLGWLWWRSYHPILIGYLLPTDRFISEQWQEFDIESDEEDDEE